MTNKPYCIVVGGGIGGLLMGLKLQSEGLDTTIIEKNSFCGGYFATFTKSNHVFDYGVSNYLGFENNGWLVAFFKKIGLLSLVQSIERLPVIDHYIFPDFEFELLADHHKVKANLISLFPQEASGINEFFGTLQELYSAITDLQTKSREQKFNSVLMKHINTRYVSYIDSIFINPHLKAILTARIFGSNVSLLTMAAYLGKILYDGMYRVTINLVEHLVEHFKTLGGTIIYNERVAEISFNDANDKAGIVYTDSGLQLQTNYVVSACDMKTTFNRLLEQSTPPKVKSKIEERGLSLSSLSFFLIFQKFPEQLKRISAGRVYLFNSYDISNLYMRKEAGELVLDDGIKVNFCRSEDADSKLLLRIEVDCSISTFSAMTDKQSIFDKVVEVLSAKLEIKLADFELAETITPIDFQYLTAATEGAASGWSPNNAYNDLPILEKIIHKNFYQTGSWDQYGSGILPIFLSVERISRNILSKMQNV